MAYRLVASGEGSHLCQKSFGLGGKSTFREAQEREHKVSFMSVVS